MKRDAILPGKQWEKWELRGEIDWEVLLDVPPTCYFTDAKCQGFFPPLSSSRQAGSSQGFLSHRMLCLLQGGGFGFGPGLLGYAIIRGCCIFGQGPCPTCIFPAVTCSIHLWHRINNAHNTRQDEAGRQLPRASPSVCLLLGLGSA